MTNPRNDLEIAAHYIIARSDSAKLGVTRLNKVLWFSDLEYHRRHGESLTGLTHYIRMPRGPVPEDIEATLNSLKEEKKIIERQHRKFNYSMRELVYVVEPNVNDLSAEKVDILNANIEQVCSLTAGEASGSTHDEYWDNLNNGDLMLVGAASVIFKAPTKMQLDWATSKTR